VSDQRTQGPGHYDQNWYPVAYSEEVVPGAVLGRDFLGGRVVSFRDDAGVAHVMTAFCAHLGADLSAGRLLAGRLECPFHSWGYGTDGRCSAIPNLEEGESIPERARLFAYPVAERWGIIWAFNGVEPLLPVPSPPMIEPGSAVWRTGHVPGLDVRFPLEPWMAMTNSHDFQHLRTLHGLRVLEGPDDLVFNDYDAHHRVRLRLVSGDAVTLHVHIFGTNALAMTMDHDEVGRTGHIIASTPMPEGDSRGFVTNATPLAGGEDEGSARSRVEWSDTFWTTIAMEDMPIFTSLKFRRGTLVGTDRVLGRYLDWVARYPKADPALTYL
jgi:phenylpropionate dioxygenase-like ring-hydroxylating dioxygenase large terminal subunit